MDENFSCCHDEEKSYCDLNSLDETSCCIAGKVNEAEETAIGEERQCCSNEGKYLKTDKEYSPSPNVKAPQTEILIAIASVLDQTDSGNFSGFGKYSHPPPHISPRNILLRNSVLLI
jgi:hypothetical protein